MSSLIEALSSLDSIQALIDTGTRESEVLEYKTASRPLTDSEKGEIAKDVSAMANSLGGTILYGVACDPSDKTRPKAIEGIDVKNIETFDRVLNAQVRPPVEGIRRRLLPNENPKVMVIEIPASESPPHQNLYDKKYYRRSGCESLPMEHDLVALHFGRRHGPILNVTVHTIEKPTPPRRPGHASTEGQLRILVSNEGRRLGRYAHLILVYPSRDLVRVFDRAGSLNVIDKLYAGRQAHEFSRADTVFHSGMYRSVAEIGISVEETFWNGSPDAPLINWVIYADEMSRREGAISLRDLGWLSAL